MSPENARAIDEVLAKLPLAARTNPAARTIILDTRAPDCLLDLVMIVSVLARRLEPAAQLAVKWEMAAATEELRVSWN